jgi:hypothetical protein
MIPSAGSLVRALVGGLLWRLAVRRLRDPSLRKSRSGLRRRSLEVVVDVERIRLPAGAGDEQCIAEIEEHWRSSKKSRAPFAHAPKQVGPFG